MANDKYWQNLAKVTWTEFEGREGSFTKEEEIARFRLDFQRGIILHMIKKEDDAERYLRTAVNSFIKSGPGVPKAGDYSARHIINWLIYNDSENRNLTTAILKLKVEIIEDVNLLGFKDIYQAVLEAKFEGEFAYPDTAQRFYEWSSPDKYPYERVADNMIRLARLQLITGDIVNSKRVIRSAQKLYREALGRIPEMLAKDNPEWEKYNSWTDQRVLEEGGDDKVAYVEKRTGYRGNIPMFRRQGEVLGEVNRLLVDDYRKSRKAAEKFLTFYKEVINPPGKTTPNLGLVEELEWVLLLSRYYRYVMDEEPVGDNRSLLRILLG